MLRHNFVKCEQIFKILSLEDSWEVTVRWVIYELLLVSIVTDVTFDSL